MPKKKGTEEARVPGGPDKRWAVLQDPAVKALLDHVAEELAFEFVRLMRASVVAEADKTPKETRL